LHSNSAQAMTTVHIDVAAPRTEHHIAGQILGLGTACHLRHSRNSVELIKRCGHIAASLASSDLLTISPYITREFLNFQEPTVKVYQNSNKLKILHHSQIITTSK